MGVYFFYIFDTKFVFPLILPTPLFYMPFLSQFLFFFREDHIKPS